jgi:hypothetical protein
MTTIIDLLAASGGTTDGGGDETNRGRAVVGGQFTDTFANSWTVHIYQVNG